MNVYWLTAVVAPFVIGAVLLVGGHRVATLGRDFAAKHSWVAGERGLVPSYLNSPFFVFG